MPDHRINELEIRAAFQEDLLESLNRTVARQQQEIVWLQEQLRFLYARVKTLAPEDRPFVAQDEVPPHY